MRNTSYIAPNHGCFRSPRLQRTRQAFTLVEVVFSTLLVGTVLVSSLYTSLAMTRSYASISNNSRAVLLAERYLTEALQTSYSDPVAATFGLEAGESGATRSNFDDVDDYHGRTESPPTSKSGDLLPDYGNDWSVSVTVTSVSPINPRQGSQSETGLKRIGVSVTDPHGVTITLYGLRASTGGKDLVLQREASYAQWIGLSLRTDGASQTLHSGTQPMNLSEVQ